MRLLHAFMILLLLLTVSLPASALTAGITLDVHQDITAPTELLPNDFHVVGHIKSYKSPPVLMDHIDGPFANFSSTITKVVPTDPSDPWYQFEADWSMVPGSIGIPYCTVIHLGLIFDVEGANTIIDVVGWWTHDGKPVGDLINNLLNDGYASVLGFDVPDISPGAGQKIRITNGNQQSLLPPSAIDPAAINMDITQMDVVTFPAGSPPDIRDLQEGGGQSAWNWIPVCNANGLPVSPKNPLNLLSSSFFDVFIESSVPGQPGLPSGQQFSIPSGGFLVARTKMQFKNAAGILEERWQWDIHQAPITPWKPGDQYKWRQLPDVSTTGIDIRMDRNDGTPRVLADDFRCMETGPITDIHFWGSWLNDIKGEIEKIHVSFHADIPDPDKDGPLFSKPQNPALWERDFFPGQFAENLYATLPRQEYEYWWDPYRGIVNPYGDKRVWQYDIEIPETEAFVQKGTPKEPIIYWMDLYVYIKGVQPPATQPVFGWKTRDWNPKNPGGGHFMDDAVYGFQQGNWVVWNELRYPKGHPLSEQSLDMAFVLTGKEHKLDWGSAPDTAAFPQYPTLAVNNGANHVIIPDYHLGASEQAEADGTPPPPAPDDDGVTFSGMYPGLPAKVKVFATAPGFLNAWIDFNGNNSWADAGEQIFTNTPLVAGVNVLTFIVPSTTEPLKTFARFRFNSEGNLSYTGPASDGEVEDYLVFVKKRPIIVNKAKAKMLPLGTPVTILSNVVTANFGTDGWYFEEPDRIGQRFSTLGRFAALGVNVDAGDSAPWTIGDIVSCIGTTMLTSNGELMLQEDVSWKEGDGVPILPLGQNNRASGGGQFGNQPGVVDFAAPLGFSRPAHGLNTIAMLVRLWGKCTYVERDALGAPVNAWINDGSDLWDGTRTPTGSRVLGVKVHFKTDPGVIIAEKNMYTVTGIMRTTPAGSGLFARWLWALETQMESPVIPM